MSQVPSTYRRLQKIISAHLGVDPDKVTPEATFESLGADSLDKIELVMEVEQEFDVEIEDSVAQPWTTVGDIETYLAAND